MGGGGGGERVGKRPREGGQQHRGSCAPSGPGDSHKGLSQSLCRTGHGRAAGHDSAHQCKAGPAQCPRAASRSRGSPARRAGTVSPKECPLVHQPPPPTCPPVPTAGNSCGWLARGPHVTRLSCRCARVNRPWSEVMPAQGNWNQRRVGGPWDWKWPGCPLTGFWGPGVRSQGEKGQACRTEEGGHAAGPRGQWPPPM